MAELELALLGSVEVTGRGVARSALGRKAGLMLGRLACPLGARHSRACLQAALWPRSDERHAQGSLRYELHELRKLLGPALVTEGTLLWLDAGRLDTDVARFERLAGEGSLAALTEACRLYRGDLLSQISPESYDVDWLLPERERLSELARTVFWTRFGLLLWRGESSDAERCALRYLQIDPHCERMNAALMRLLIAQGRRAAAARHYARTAERLWRDLRLRPGVDLEAAEASLGVPGRSRRRPLDAARVLGREGEAALDAPPLVAVTLFRDLSDEACHAALAATLTEDVISDLARFRRLAVLGRTTAFGLATREDAAGWMRRLGVLYIVEGSVRHTGNSLEVAVRLIANASGRCLWATRCRGGIEGLPDFQEETARAIVSAVQIQVESAETARIRHLPIESLTAYELYLRGREQQRSTTANSHAAAFRCFSDAVERDPDFAAAHAALSLSYFNLGACSRSEDGGEKLRRALDHAGRAIALDPLCASGHWMHGMLLQMLREFDAATPDLQRAVALSPGDAETLGFSGLEQAYAGHVDEGAALVQRAIRLEPGYPPVFAELMGKSEYIAKRYSSALFWLRQSPDRVPTNRAWLAASAAQEGLTTEAAAHARAATATLERRLGRKRLAEIGGTVAWLREPARFRHAADLDHYEEGLRRAGLT